MAAPALLTRCDDLGSFRSATQAIARACTEGIGRNVSLMACAPHIAHAAEVLAGRRDICFGLHATVHCEWGSHRWGPLLPAAQVPSLVQEDGTFLPSPQHTHERGVVVEQILAEVRAQIAHARALGFHLSYLDTHMVWEWMHPPACPHQRVSAPLAALARAEGLYWYAEAQPYLLRNPGSVADLAHALWQLPDDSLSLTVQHPASDDLEMRSVLAYSGQPAKLATERVHQYRLFTDPEILGCVQARGVRLLRYDELP